jgi:hypothetical protein
MKLAAIHTERSQQCTGASGLGRQKAGQETTTHKANNNQRQCKYQNEAAPHPIRHFLPHPHPTHSTLPTCANTHLGPALHNAGEEQQKGTPQQLPHIRQGGRRGGYGVQAPPVCGPATHLPRPVNFRAERVCLSSHTHAHEPDRPHSQQQLPHRGHDDLPGAVDLT